jgi:hypothetical protein
MQQNWLSLVFALVFVVLGAVGVRADLPPGVPPEGKLVFSVQKSGSEVGSHKITFSQKDDVLLVETESALRLRVAFVTVYRYTQRTRETWRDGVLIGLDSSIDDNGTPFRIKAEQRDGQLHIDGHQENHVVALDVKPLSYWNVAITKVPRGFDVQWGSLAELAVEPRGPETRQVAGQPVEARRYAMRGYEIRKGERQTKPWLNVDAWYDSGDRLVGLSFHYRGFDFDYVRQ